MSDDTQPTEDEVFNEAYALLTEEKRPLDARLKDVLSEVDQTTVDAKDVLIAYGASLREDDPLDNNNRRVSTLITTAERHDISLSLEEIIDAAIRGNTGPKTTTATTESDIQDTDEAVNIVDRSKDPEDVNTPDNITFDIDFEDAEAVKNAAVNVYRNSDLSLQQKREHLKGLLTQAEKSGVSIKPSEVRAAIIESRNDDSDDYDTDIAPSEATPDADHTDLEDKTDKAHLNIIDTSVSSTGIHAGESVKVTVTVENEGESVGLKDVRISKNHEVITKNSLTVKPGETTTESFDIRFDSGGQHLLQVNEQSPVSITVLTPAEVIVTDLTTTDTQIAPDDTTTITATLENTGDLTGQTELDLIVDNQIFETRDISIDGNTVQDETFEIELDRPGEYTVSVGSQELDITALQPASVNVTGYRLSSTGLELGEELTVNVDIANTGDLDGTIAVALYTNDSTVETKSVTVPGQDTSTINFTTTFDRTGSHTVTINNLDQTDITVLKPASTTVREFSVNDASLAPDETLGVAAVLDNTGDLSDTQTVNVSINGDLIHTEDVQVPGNETKNITIGPGADIDIDFAEYLEKPNEYSISINGLPPETVEVLEPPSVNVRYYSLSTSDVVPGEEFEVSVEIENTGDVAGETDIEIYADNELLETETVEVDGNSDKRGTFTQTLPEPGTYSLVVNNLEPSDVVVRGTGEFNITDISVDTLTDTLYVGDEIAVTFTAENNTSLSSEQTTTVYLGGVELTSRVFQLPGNAEETFTIQSPVEQPGVYDLEVNDTLVTTLEILPELIVADLTDAAYIEPITRCIKQKSDGNRCSRDAEDESIFCWQHEDALQNIHPRDVQMCQFTSDTGDVCELDAETGGILCEDHNPLETAFEPEPLDEHDQKTDTEETEWGEPLEEETDDETEDESDTPDTLDSPDDDTEGDIDDGTDTDESLEDSSDSVTEADEPDKHGDAHKRTIPGADDTDGRFNQNTNTRTLVGFDFVLDSNEDILPSDVDGAGMVVDNNEYIGIAEVHPRSWSIHTPEEKQQIVNQYRTMFLGSLDFPVQIVCYPTEFDISEHITALENRTQSEHVRDDESFLLNIGRKVYPNWLREYIAHSQMKQRNFYIIVRVKPEQLNRFRTSDGGVIDTIDARAPAIANLLKKVIPGAGDKNQTNDVTRRDCLIELHDRLQRIESALSPMGVNVDPLTSRDEAMTVLYQYYNNEHPIVDNFDVATRSEFDPTMRIDDGDWPTDAMSNIHYEEFVSSEDNQ